jgi:hypothetical protein
MRFFYLMLSTVVFFVSNVVFALSTAPSCDEKDAWNIETYCSMYHVTITSENHCEMYYKFQNYKAYE